MKRRRVWIPWHQSGGLHCLEQGCLICLGRCNITPQTGWLRKLFISHSHESWKPQIKVPGGTCFLVTLSYLHMVETRALVSFSS